MAIERVLAYPLVVGAVGADLFDLSGHVLKQIWQGLGVDDIVRAGHDADDFERRLINAEVEFAPGPAFPDAVLADFPFAFAVNFDAGRIHRQVTWLRPIIDRQGDRQSPSASWERRMIWRCEIELHQFEDRLEKALSLPTGQSVHRSSNS